jgi:Xaa-Pro dipeptidase
MFLPIAEIQQHLRRDGLDGWLLCLFKEQNPLAARLLRRPAGQVRTRRAFYWIPADGEPLKLQHRIERRTLEGLPGALRSYLSHRELHGELASLLAGCRRVALEYSPHGALPAVSLVDAGTVELLRSLGVEPASSADLLQWFEARLDDDQLASHLEAAGLLTELAHEAFSFVQAHLLAGEPVDEVEVQHLLLEGFAANGLVCDHPPIVAVGPHAGDPHYEPGHAPGLIGRDEVLLIDLWAKLDKPRAVYADQTWMGYTGREVPAELRRVWELVRDARRAGWRLVAERIDAGLPVEGREVDDAVRAVIAAGGLGAAFVHRTGHSIGEEPHGAGANLDNLETCETRRLIPGSVFSVEPGVYLPAYGMRSEFNLLIDAQGRLFAAEGSDQDELFTMDLDGPRTGQEG